MFDVIIIGGGVIGCAIARELARFKLGIAVLDVASDVAMGASKANSGVVHAGHSAPPGSMKARFNVRGNAIFEQWSRELNFPFKRNGSLVLCFAEKDLPHLNEILVCGRHNHVADLQILKPEQVFALEPNLNEKVVGALHSPQAGICCPYEMTVALAENAAANGVEFYLKTQVTGVEKSHDGLIVQTSGPDFKGRVLINAAGVHADEINNMASTYKFKLIPRAGQYIVLDKNVGTMVSHSLFQLPTVMGKGVLVTPTVDGNLLLGPTAFDLTDKAETGTSYLQHETILQKAALSLRHLPISQIITSFTGLRAHSSANDFIIGWSEDVANLFNVAGIESPGLSSAPAIAVHVAGQVAQKLRAETNNAFNPVRQGIKKLSKLAYDAQQALVVENHLYGHVVCRCENVSEAEVLAAIRIYPGASDLDGIKRRTRCGMGRCQGGFCSPHVVDILARELQVEISQITKHGNGSRILMGKEETG